MGDRRDDVETALQRFEQLPRLVGANADLIRRGRFLDCDFEIGVGPVPLHVVVRGGLITSVKRGPFLLKPTAFQIHADAATWLAFLEAVPRPGVHDILALNKTGRARISGNLVPFMANLQYIKDVLAAARTPLGEGQPA